MTKTHLLREPYSPTFTPLEGYRKADAPRVGTGCETAADADVGWWLLLNSVLKMSALTLRSQRPQGSCIDLESIMLGAFGLA